MAEWIHEPNLIAERFKRDEIPGFLKGKFLAKDDEFIVLEKKNEIYRERGPGECDISRIMEDSTAVLLIDKSEKAIEKVIKNVWLLDGKKTDIRLVIRFRVFHSHHFSKNMMSERCKFFLEDVWNQVASKLLNKKTLPELQRRPSKEFFRKEFVDGTKERVETDVKSLFRKWGLLLTSFSLDIRMPEGAVRDSAEKDEETEKPAENKEGAQEPERHPESPHEQESGEEKADSPEERAEPESETGSQGETPENKVLE